MRIAFTALTLVLVLVGCTGGNSAQTADELIRQAQQAAAAQKHDDARKLLDQAVRLAPTNAVAHYALAAFLDNQRQFTDALASLDQALNLNSNYSLAYQLRGMVNFKLARVDRAIEDFNQFILRNPGQVAYHWQRGIALYYAGLYADGRLQFEVHRKVNPQDVENAVWHFLCNARVKGIETARRELIPVTGDTRVPMREIHDLFAGKGSAEKVLAAAAAAGEPARRNALFYAHLYLGLYHEALGDSAQSRQHIEKAAGEFSQDHFMGDVARVHLKLRNAAAAPAEGKKPR
jgi:lipoprotein NlpI